jgi:hypothetical protein
MIKATAHAHSARVDVPQAAISRPDAQPLESAPNRVEEAMVGSPEDAPHHLLPAMHVLTPMSP